jgi:hypothetical protein
MKKTTKTETKEKAPKKEVVESAEYLAQKAYLEEYAVRHPEKWEANKEALLAKLESLK